ncbi:MAG: 23S rRNA (adenine(2503)-C(2))-methyltransferase RlmN [Polyangiaceae bacterium]
MPLKAKEPQPLARTPEEWAVAARVLFSGARAFHGKQIFKWIHARGVLDPAEMSDLPRGLREALATLELPKIMTVATEKRAQDATRKLLVQMKDGATVETVLIPSVTGGPNGLPSPVENEQDADAAAAVEEEDQDLDQDLGKETKKRVTQCISTQVGCAMGCVFCASGVAGLKRQMTAEEIVAQVLIGKTRLEPGEELRNVVLMGMGEPLHNYEETARALRLLTHPDGIALSNRRVTVSTSGLIPEIARLGKDFQGQIGLAISLHAAENATRSSLMPINKKYPLPKLIDALRAYPLPKRRRITIEYTLVAGNNDTPSEAKKLVRLLRNLPVKVNLIPVNPIEAREYGPPSMEGVLAFQKVLCDAGYSCFIRRRRGDDVSAACGQLVLLGAKPKVRVRPSA